MKRKFVDEVLVEGALYHVLECGHFHDAVNEGNAMLPREIQECRACERPEPLLN